MVAIFLGLNVLTRHWLHYLIVDSSTVSMHNPTRMPAIRLRMGLSLAFEKLNTHNAPQLTQNAVQFQ